MNQGLASFPQLRIDSINACVWLGEQPIALAPKAYAVLHYLSEHPGRLVTKQELLDAVWPRRCITDAVLKVAIREIRKALGDQPKAPKIIETLHRRGYRLIAELNAESAIKVSARNRAISRLSHPIGRGQVLERLHVALDRAREGRRQVVFVSGEAGIGKTTVVDAFAEQVAAGEDWLHGRGQCIAQYSAGEAYSPWLQAISEICGRPDGRHVVPLLGHYAPSWLAQLPWLAGEVGQTTPEPAPLNPTRERMLREMAELLEALTVETPVLLVLEDLHWCDHSALDLVSMLAQRRGRARLMVVVTYRPVEAILAEHPLRSVKQELVLHGCCAELPLDDLSRQDVHTYLVARLADSELPLGLPAFIHQRTDGNPLFMVNVVDYLLAQEVLIRDDGGWRLRAAIEGLHARVPESLRQMIERQIDRRSRAEIRVLEAASIAGPEFAAAKVAAALQRDTTETEAHLMRLAQQAQFLRQRGVEEWPDGTASGRYAFVHPLYQSVLYQRQTETALMGFHRRIGEHLERAYTGRIEEVAAELALHFEHGRDYPKVIDCLRQAARIATSRYTHREAIGYLTRALALTNRLPAGDRWNTHMTLLGQRGHVRRVMADMQGAAEDFEALAARAHEQSQHDREAMALVACAIALSWVDRRRCLAVVAQLKALAVRLQDPQLRIHARGWAGYWRLLWRGWHSDDARACARAVRSARLRGDARQLNLLLGRSCYFHSLRSRYQLASRTAEKAARLALETDTVFEYLLAHFFRAWALLHLGEWGKMHTVLGNGLQVAERNGQRLWALLFRLQFAWLSIEAFDFAGARALAEQGLKEARDYKFPYGEVTSSVLLGRAYLGLAEHELAFRHFHGLRQRLARERVLMDWILRMPLYLGLGEYWYRQRDYGRARRDAGRLYASAARPGERTYQAGKAGAGTACDGPGPLGASRGGARAGAGAGSRRHVSTGAVAGIHHRGGVLPARRAAHRSASILERQRRDTDAIGRFPDRRRAIARVAARSATCAGSHGEVRTAKLTRNWRTSAHQAVPESNLVLSCRLASRVSRLASRVSRRANSARSRRAIPSRRGRYPCTRM